MSHDDVYSLRGGDAGGLDDGSLSTSLIGRDMVLMQISALCSSISSRG